MPSRHHICVAATVLTLAAALLAGCGSSSKPSTPTVKGPGAGKPTVTLGTKNFPEQFLLGELYAQALRARGFKVSLKSDVGATEIIYRALTLGTLDAYPEYTGILRTVIGNETTRALSATDAYRQARHVAARDGIVMLEPTPFVDRDVLAVKPAFAQRYHLRSIPDLATVPRTVKISGAPEFRTRVEGFLGLKEVYGLRNMRFVPRRIGTQYRALDDGSVDAADVFTTDGQLQSSTKYVVLRDPKNLFGFQNEGPLVRQKVLDVEGPEFADTLNAVSRKLTTKVMRAMNASVVLQGQSPAVVARQFLSANHLN
ncbi:MAG TPA: glycine betaine ABC transporter substrate-binding protein [Thermoleophilaceae bacterium]